MGAGKSDARAPKEQVTEIKKDKAQPQKGPPSATQAVRKNIIRIMGTDLDGDAPMAHALTGIRGVSHNFSRALLHVAGIERKGLLKNLKEEQLTKLEEIVKNPAKFGIPTWMVNRQKDYTSGQNLHTTGSDLTVILREDLNRLKKIRSYRGIRHELGQPTRGQRTKSSFRTGRSVGVQKRKDAKKGK